MADFRALKYYVVDAFTDAPLKGNPAAVCVLETEADEKWMKAVGREFNLSATCFLNQLLDSHSSGAPEEKLSIPRYRIRWFAPDAELNICGHGSIASCYVLFSTGIVKSNTIELHTNSGIMLAEKVPSPKSEKSDLNNNHDGLDNGKKLSNFKTGNDFSVRLAFPLIPLIPYDDFDNAETHLIPKSMNIRAPHVAFDNAETHLIPKSKNIGADPNILELSKMAYEGELLVMYESGEDVKGLQPSFDEIKKWPGRGVVVTGRAPAGSGFDFFSRFLCPNLGMNEDPVCGSVHCGLAPYWSKKLGKKDLKAYMVSPRGGELVLQVDEDKEKVFIQGKAAPVMEGLLYA